MKINTIIKIQIAIILIVIKITTNINAKNKNKNISKKHNQQQSTQPRITNLKTQALNTNKQDSKNTLQTNHNHKILKQIKKSETNKLIKTYKLRYIDQGSDL